jgi:hypothetical protein
MSVTHPRQTMTALKEWATVLEAMRRGEQLVLIRKGGLIEPGGGFELAAECFVFYPTFEHQAVTYLRPEYRRYFEEALGRRAPDGRVRFDCFGVAGEALRVADPAQIARLAPFHTYGPDFVTQRLKWQPEQPLTVVPVRVFELAEPSVVPVEPEYAGCKSWVVLRAPVALESARPVLDDTAFQRRLAQLRAAFS